MTQGYYRYPTIFNDQIVFSSEEDLWRVSINGGVPYRLTTGLGSATHPVFSPDGKWLAFAGTEEGHSEVYVMPSQGGAAERLTYLGDQVQVVDWTDEGIFFSSSSAMPFARVNQLFTINMKDKQPKPLNVGPANHITKGVKGASVIQRHGYREYGYWKRYRGGTAGNLWIDSKGDGQFKELIALKGNLFRPQWVGDRIYFVSDHEGIGNIYSCSAEGKSIQRHTDQKDYYVRYIHSDGKSVVYNAGGDLFVLDLKTNKSRKLKVEYQSSRTQRNRKFVPASRYLEDFSLSPRGDYLTTVSRGKAFYLSNWEGPVLQFGVSETARYRLPVWLNDGQRILVVSDEDGEESLEIYNANTLKRVGDMNKASLGRIIDIKVAPESDEIVLSNHRCELIHVDLKTWKTKVLDKSSHIEIQGFDWSPDGKWVAYGCAVSHHQWVIKMVDVKKGKIHEVTKPLLKDVSPSFDPEGNFLYFLSFREFNPYMDSLHFEYGFPNGMKPYLVTLRKDVENPFVDRPADLKEKKEPKEDKKKSSKKVEPLKIDFDQIAERIIPFPVDEGLYDQIIGLKGKVMFTSHLAEGRLGHPQGSEPEADCEVFTYDFESQKTTSIYDGITEVSVNQDRSSSIYRIGNKLRVGRAGEKMDTDSESDRYSKKNGWIQLTRIKVEVDPVAEWRQMYREAWRLQRDHFWREDMSKVNWDKAYNLYEPLLDRIGTREELSDIIWEMQGELGASHAYVFGGDVRYPPHYGVGNLAADLEYDEKAKAYRINKIIRGDSWKENHGSPLSTPGLNINEKDLIWAVNGKVCNKATRPESHLMSLAGQEVQLTVSDPHGKKKRQVTVQTLRSQYMARYREWVEKNRAYVHEKSKGKIGYIHIPDMSPFGFAEFHRGFLAELDRDGLVVDARFNGGGHVSQLLIEKLARRRLGYDQCRWFGLSSYPEDAPQGPMVCLTNEYAGSDGDMFSHVFKMMKLGPLLGKRTWGGVIGIWPRHALVDGGMTTQPEFSFWFRDVGWGIENYGVDPDIEVEFTPQDYAAGNDPQLDRSIEEVQKIIKKSPPLKEPVAA